MTAVRTASLILLLMAAPAMAQPAAAPAPAWSWYERDADGKVRVNLYLFWSSTCPHCPKAVEFAEDMKKRNPWINVTMYEVTGTPANRQLYQQMAESLKMNAGTTPAFFYCKTLQQGYHSHEQTGARIEADLKRWYDALRKHFKEVSAIQRAMAVVLLLTPPLGEAVSDPAALDLPPEPDLPIDLPPAEEVVTVPWWGEVSASSLSLPALTLVLAGCDAFNPCAFFVLLTLLSLMVHSRSRTHMLVVGGVFVFFSGLMYFLFMAAWLNLFLVMGEMRVITLLAGIAAVCAAVLNVKDFFWFKAGPSLSIPESAKPGLFKRMGGLVHASSFPVVLIGTASVAFVANTYELLCTAGFPMVYTRVLTLRELSPTEYYGYLAAYNLIYVAPLALIVTGFALTLGSRKLSEYEGRVLKLLSGMMLLGLGGTLVLRPEWLNTAIGAVAVLGAAIGGTLIVVLLDRLAHGGRGRHAVVQT